MTLANLLTGLRLALVPVIGFSILRGSPHTLWLFLASALTDLVDGLAARTISRPSRLGQLLDPVADKATLVVAFTAGAIVGMFPVWFVVLLATRDLAQLSIAAKLLFRHRKTLDLRRFEPTPIGKYAATGQFLSLLGALLHLDGIGNPHSHPWMAAWMLATAALTLVAGAQYLGRFVGPSEVTNP